MEGCLHRLFHRGGELLVSDCPVHRVREGGMRGVPEAPQGLLLRRCFHVTGSMLKRANPQGAERCVPKWQVRNCSDPSNVKLSQLAAKDCSCLAPDSLGTMHSLPPSLKPLTSPPLAASSTPLPFYHPT